MKIAYKQESRNWAIYFATILISVYIHEVGHCIPAWIHGFRAIPTPAKEYTFVTIPNDLQQYILAGRNHWLCTYFAIYYYILHTETRQIK